VASRKRSGLRAIATEALKIIRPALHAAARTTADR